MQRYPLQDVTDQFAMERPGLTTFCLRRQSPDELYQQGLRERIRRFRSRPDLVRVQLGRRTDDAPPGSSTQPFNLESLLDSDLVNRELDDYFTSLFTPRH